VGELSFLLFVFVFVFFRSNSNAMVFYFTPSGLVSPLSFSLFFSSEFSLLQFRTDPEYVVFMGKDKYENEDLIKYGWPEDIW
jgi:hypothetical protein